MVNIYSRRVCAGAEEKRRVLKAKIRVGERRLIVDPGSEGEGEWENRTLRSQFAFKSKLLGFKSRWSTSAECRAFNALRVYAHYHQFQIPHNQNKTTQLT
jgi:hypothetical protein